MLQFESRSFVLSFTSLCSCSWFCLSLVLSCLLLPFVLFILLSIFRVFGSFLYLVSLFLCPHAPFYLSPFPSLSYHFPRLSASFFWSLPFFLYADSDDFTAYCLILPLLGIGPEWWMDSHNIHHVVCNDVHCGEEIVWASWGGGLLRAANSISPPTPTINTNITTTNATKNICHSRLQHGIPSPLNAPSPPSLPTNTTTTATPPSPPPTPPQACQLVPHPCTYG